MTEDIDLRSSPQILSVHLDGDLADEIDSIARLDGVSRSALLRRLLLSSLDTEKLETVRLLRRLRAAEGELAQIHKLLEDLEADDAAEAIEDAVEAIVVAVDELQDFEPDDE